MLDIALSSSSRILFGAVSSALETAESFSLLMSERGKLEDLICGQLVPAKSVKMAIQSLFRTSLRSKVYCGQFGKQFQEYVLSQSGGRQPKRFLIITALISMCNIKQNRSISQHPFYGLIAYKMSTKTIRPSAPY